MATKVEGLRCICGNASIYSEPIIVRDLVVNQLYCPECGIIMRSPQTDKGGRWLRKHWANIHRKGGAHNDDKTHSVQYRDGTGDS